MSRRIIPRSSLSIFIVEVLVATFLMVWNPVTAWANEGADSDSNRYENGIRMCTAEEQEFLRGSQFEDETRKGGNQDGMTGSAGNVMSQKYDGPWLEEGTEENKVAQEIFDFWTKEIGASGAFASGVLGNVYHETGGTFKPNVAQGGGEFEWQHGTNPSTGGADAGGGLYQFTPYTKYTDSDEFHGDDQGGGWAVHPQNVFMWKLEFRSGGVAFSRVPLESKGEYQAYSAIAVTDSEGNVEDSENGFLTTTDVDKAAINYELAVERPAEYHRQRADMAQAANKVFNKDNIRPDTEKIKEALGDGWNDTGTGAAAAKSAADKGNGEGAYNHLFSAPCYDPVTGHTFMNLKEAMDWAQQFCMSSGSRDGGRKGKLLIIGDSITVRAQQSGDLWKEKLPNAKVIAKGAMGFDWGLEQLEGESVSDYSAVVMLLGTNGGLTQEKFDKIKDLVGSKRLVMMTVGGSHPNVQAVMGDHNRLIDENKDQIDGVVDWKKVVDADPGVLDDGVHPGVPDGITKFVDEVVKVAGKFGGKEESKAEDGESGDNKVVNGVTISNYSKLRPATQEFAEAVANEFGDDLELIGGWRATSGPTCPTCRDHPEGYAADIMIPHFRDNKSLGDEINEWVWQHGNEYKVDYTIWWNEVYNAFDNHHVYGSYTIDGDPTGGHFDHVHVTVDMGLRDHNGSTGTDGKSRGKKNGAGCTASGSTSKNSSVSAEGVAIPAEGTISTGYGMRWGTMHAAIDIAAPLGAPVYAAADGTVILANGTQNPDGYGNWIKIDHGGGLVTGYGHLESFTVSEGDKVKAGDQIGTVDSTGRSTGNHLDFQVYKDGEAQNPFDFFHNSGCDGFPENTSEGAASDAPVTKDQCGG